MGEKRAIARLKQGDIGGLETLVRQYQVSAVRAAYLITRDRALAEDIVQTAFLRAYQRIDQFDANQSFSPWFLRSVINDAIKATRRRERHVPLEAQGAKGHSLFDRLADSGPGPDELAEEADTRETVWPALEKLPPAQRAAIVMRYYLELSEAEMASDLIRPRGTIKWRLHAARERLRALLRPLWQAESSESGE